MIFVYGMQMNLNKHTLITMRNTRKHKKKFQKMYKQIQSQVHSIPSQTTKAMPKTKQIGRRAKQRRPQADRPENIGADPEPETAERDMLVINIVAGDHGVRLKD